MKIISNNLKDYLTNNTINFIKCFKIILNSGSILTFTNYKENIIIDNIEYKNSNAFQESNTINNSNLSNNTSNVLAFLDGDYIKTEDVLSGKFDNAKIEIFLININDNNKEKINIINGFIDTIKTEDSKIYFNIVGILSLLDRTIGEIYSPLCRTSFCSEKCKLNKNDYTFIGTITNVINEVEFTTTSTNIINKNNDYFKYGIITFTNGYNNGKSIEIKQSKDGNISLTTKPFYKLSIGDTFNIIAGCDKNFTTCIDIFNNAINFRGEPNLPRTTKVYKFY